MNEPTHLDLFSGIGGFSLAAESAGFRTIAFAELDHEAGIVLSHHWPHVPNLRDIRTIGVHSALGCIDLLTAGVPCQPASLLGKRMGSADERWLWPDTIRIVRELRPRFCIFENPPALLSLDDGRAFAGILGGLAECGYDVLWGVIPAAAVGAGHLRRRVCIVAANTDCYRCKRQRQDRQGSDENESGKRNKIHPFICFNTRHATPNIGTQGQSEKGIAADSHYTGLQRHTWDEESHGGRQGRPRTTATPSDLRGRVTSHDWWHETHTGVPVLAHGVSARLAEAAARCTGNSIVPQAFYPILKAIRDQII